MSSGICEELSANLVRIHLADLWPRHEPQRLLGRFNGDELVFASAPDMGLHWRRKPDETPVVSLRHYRNA